VANNGSKAPLLSDHRCLHPFVKTQSQAPCLTSLDLRGCGSLERLSLLCPRLEALDATFCGALCDATLRDLAGCSEDDHAEGDDDDDDGEDEGDDDMGGDDMGGAAAAGAQGAAAVRALPPLKRLVLSVCPQVRGRFACTVGRVSARVKPGTPVCSS